MVCGMNDFLIHMGLKGKVSEIKKLKGNYDHVWIEMEELRWAFIWSLLQRSFPSWLLFELTTWLICFLKWYEGQVYVKIRKYKYKKGNISILLTREKQCYFHYVIFCPKNVYILIIESGPNGWKKLIISKTS